MEKLYQYGAVGVVASVLLALFVWLFRSILTRVADRLVGHLDRVDRHMTRIEKCNLEIALSLHALYARLGGGDRGAVPREASADEDVTTVTLLRRLRQDTEPPG